MSYEFASPQTLDDALDAWKTGAQWFAGGTDLVPEFKLGLVLPTRLVNLKRIPNLNQIEADANGVRIGALATLAQIAADEHIRADYRALAQACELSASPQIRNVGTIGGNLCQDSRCPYYRGDFRCYLKGGDACFMREGENRSAAVIGYQECVHAHPSDPANALVALDAEIIARGREGERVMRASEFFRAPQGDERRMNVLNAGEFIQKLQLPKANNTRSVCLKAMDRAIWTFALVSVAARVDFEGARVAAARVVLGGVAPVPWREARVEEMLRGMRLDEDSIARAAREVLTDAQPLAQNGYKVRLARALVRRALLELSASNANSR